MIWWELVPVVDQLFCVYLVFKWLLVANSNVAEQVVSWQLRRQSCLFVHHNGSTFCGMNLWWLLGKFKRLNFCSCLTWLVANHRLWSSNSLLFILSLNGVCSDTMTLVQYSCGISSCVQLVQPWSPVKIKDDSVVYSSIGSQCLENHITGFTWHAL